MYLSRGERFKGARIIHNKNGKQTQAEVYAATGIPASCIKDLEDDDVQRNVGYETIAKLASHYGVSADWLLGIPETRTPDANIQEICKYTGLSESAVNMLHEISNMADKSDNKVLYSVRDSILYLINDLILKAKSEFFKIKPYIKEG